MRGIDIDSVPINATTLMKKGVRQFIAGRQPDRNYNFDNLEGDDNSVRYAYAGQLWSGSPAGLVLSYGTVNNPDTSSARTIQYVAEIFIAFDTNDIYSRIHNTAWKPWKKVISTAVSTASLNSEDMIQNNVIEHNGGGITKHPLRHFAHIRRHGERRVA